MKISFVVPFYNASKSLNKTIESIIKQSYKSIEVIMVDDGSNDDSVELSDKLAEEYSNIKVFHQKNLGPSAARNNGLKNVTGDYFCFVDSDDWIDNNYVELAVNELKRNPVDILLTPYIREYGKKREYNYLFKKPFVSLEKSQELKVLRRLIGPTGRELETPGRVENLNPIWSKFYKTSLLKKIKFVDRSVLAAEDLWFNIQAFNISTSCSYINTAFYHYNKTNTKSIVHTYNANFFDQYKILYRKIKDFLSDNHFSPHFFDALNNRIVVNLISIFINYSKSSNVFIARKFLIRILNDPIYIYPLQHFEYSKVPFPYRIFFMACKHKIVLPLLYGVKFLSNINYRKQ